MSFVRLNSCLNGNMLSKKLKFKPAQDHGQNAQFYYITHCSTPQKSDTIYQLLYCVIHHSIYLLFILTMRLKPK